MKNITELFVAIMVAMVFVSCEPVEKRQEAKGRVTDEDINKYVSVTAEVREGKRSNFLLLKSEGLKALTSFQHGLGTYVGTNGRVQGFVVSGAQEVIVNILNPDGTKVTKTYPVDVEQCFDVAAEWAIFCGTGSKVWEWDTSVGDGIHGMGDVNDDCASWWTIGNPESRVAAEGVGATFTLTAIGSSIVKNRTDGTTEPGTFSFSMTPKANFSRSLGQFTTSGATILSARNSKGGEVENKFEIVRLNDDELRLLVIDMDGRDTYNVASEGWGQATHWCFRAVK